MPERIFPARGGPEPIWSAASEARSVEDKYRNALQDL